MIDVCPLLYLACGSIHDPGWVWHHDLFFFYFRLFFCSQNEKYKWKIMTVYRYFSMFHNIYQCFSVWWCVGVHYFWRGGWHSSEESFCGRWLRRCLPGAHRDGGQAVAEGRGRLQRWREYIFPFLFITFISFHFFYFQLSLDSIFLIRHISPQITAIVVRFPLPHQMI